MHFKFLSSIWFIASPINFSLLLYQFHASWAHEIHIWKTVRVPILNVYMESIAIAAPPTRNKFFNIFVHASSRKPGTKISWSSMKQIPLKCGKRVLPTARKSWYMFWIIYIYFESMPNVFTPDFSLLSVFLSVPVLLEGCKQGKNSVALYYCCYKFWL